MLLSDENLKPYSDTLYHNEELKSLTRYRFDKVRERALKNSIARLVNILFPEIEKLVPTLHMKSIYALLLEFPSARHIAKAHLTRLTNLLRWKPQRSLQQNTAIRFGTQQENSIWFIYASQSYGTETYHRIDTR